MDVLIFIKQNGDDVSNTVTEVDSLGHHVSGSFVVISKGVWPVKLYSNEMLLFLTAGGEGISICPVF